MPEQPLIIKRPPAAKPAQFPNKPDFLSPIEHFFGVATGLAEQQPRDTSDAIAATAGLLPIGALMNKLGKAGSVLGKRLMSPKPTPKALTLEAAQNFKPTGPVNFNKAELPAEFQASGLEQSLYNNLRKKRQEMRKPPVTEIPVGSQGGEVVDPIRAAREKNKGKELAAVRGSAIEEPPASFDDYMKQDADNLHENAGGRGSNAGQFSREGESYLEQIPGQQTFGDLGVTKNNANEMEIGRDFMQDYNDFQKHDNDVLDLLNNVFTRHDRQVLQPRRGPTETMEAFRMKNAEQTDIPFGPGAPLFSADASIPPYKANEAIQGFNDAFNHVKDVDMLPQMMEPSDLAPRVHIRPDDGGIYSTRTKNLEMGIAGPTPIAAHELRHASDNFRTPRIFDDYPMLFGRNTTDTMPPEYWRHPSEVRARATGAIGDLLDERRKTGQQILPPDFLEEYGRKLATIEGNVNGDTKVMRDEAMKSYNPFQFLGINQPRQRAFDFDAAAADGLWDNLMQRIRNMGRK
jgi:hypothetical protein